VNARDGETLDLVIRGGRVVDPGAGIDVIVSGHSHVPNIDSIGGVLYLNPGSAGRRRFNLPVTVATLEVVPLGMRPAIHHLE